MAFVHKYLFIMTTSRGTNLKTDKPFRLDFARETNAPSCHVPLNTLFSARAAIISWSVGFPASIDGDGSPMPISPAGERTPGYAEIFSELAFGAVILMP